MKKLLLSIVAILALCFAANAEKWEKVTDPSTLKDGDVVVLTYESSDKGNWIASGIGTNIIDRKELKDNLSEGLRIVLTKKSENWIMSCKNTDGSVVYIQHKDKKNQIDFVASSTQLFSIEKSTQKENVDGIKIKRLDNEYCLQYNSSKGTERFTFYPDSQRDCSMYKMIADENVSDPVFSVIGINSAAYEYKTYVGRTVSVSCPTPNSTVSWLVIKNNGTTQDLTGTESYTIPSDAVVGDVFDFLAEAKLGAISSKSVDIKVTVIETKGTAENPYSVSDIINGEYVATPNENVWVKGWVIGSIDSGNKLQATKDYLNSNLAIADSNEGHNDGDNISNGKFIGVYLTSGNVRTNLDLTQKASSVLGREFAFKGNIEKYFGVNGVKGTSEYKLLTDIDTSVADVFDGAEGAVRYYDVNGREVAADAKGIVIRVQGTKAVKLFNK